MYEGYLSAARWAQRGGQALAGLALLLHLIDLSEFSAITVGFLVAAFLVPFRNDGSNRDLAICNFGSALTLAGFVGWYALAIGLNLFRFGWGGVVLSAEMIATVVSMIMFVFAGAFFWLNREGGR